MRRLIAALALVIVVVSLAACGGGGSANTPAPTVSAAEAPPAPPAPTAASSQPSNTLSPHQQPVNVPFPVGASTSPQVKQQLDAHQPLIILYYDPTQLTTNDQKAAIDAAMAKYRGLITLFQYDVTGALPENSPNTTASKEVALETGQLGVTFTPYVFVVDKAGIIIARYAGYIDSETLQFQILRATQ